MRAPAINFRPVLAIFSVMGMNMAILNAFFAFALLAVAAVIASITIVRGILLRIMVIIRLGCCGGWRALLDAAVNVFDEMRQGFKRIEFLADPTSGELAVGCPEIILAGVLPAITEHFLQQHPRVQLRVIHADTALMQFDELRKHNVEILIGRMPWPCV